MEIKLTNYAKIAKQNETKVNKLKLLLLLTILSFFYSCECVPFTSAQQFGVSYKRK